MAAILKANEAVDGLLKLPRDNERVQRIFQIDRAIVFVETNEKIVESGLPPHWWIGYTSKLDFEMESDLEEHVRVVKQHEHIKRDDANKRIVAVVVLFGKQGSSLVDDESSDWMMSASNNGGFIFRTSHVLPLFEFRHDDCKNFDEIKDAVVNLLEKTVFRRAPNLPDDSLGRPQSDAVLHNHNNSPVFNPRNVHLWDVLCDRKDVRCPGHFGNRRFGIVVCMSMTRRDDNLKDVLVRVRVARSIVAAVHNGDPGGRFLGRTTTGTWKEVHDTLAIKFISLILKVADRKRDEAGEGLRWDSKVIADSVKYSMHPNDDNELASVTYPPASE